MKKKINIFNVDISYDKNNIKIIDSYKIKKPIMMELILSRFKKETGYKSKRTMESWIKEWTTHNRLYKLGLYKKHTKDCDLEENENKFRLFIYNILGR